MAGLGDDDGKEMLREGEIGVKPLGGVTWSPGDTVESGICTVVADGGALDTSSEKDFVEWGSGGCGELPCCSLTDVMLTVEEVVLIVEVVVTLRETVASEGLRDELVELDVDAATAGICNAAPARGRLPLSIE